MPFPNGEMQYEDSQNWIFVLPAMLVSIPPRLLSLVLIASIFKPWIILWMLIVGIMSLVFHRFAESAEYSILGTYQRKKVHTSKANFNLKLFLLKGVYCSFFSSCIIKSKKGRFLQTTAFFPIFFMFTTILFFVIGLFCDLGLGLQKHIDEFLCQQDSFHRKCEGTVKNEKKNLRLP